MRQRSMENPCVGISRTSKSPKSTALNSAVKETAPATETAAALLIENYSLTLSKLKATAEDSSETLSNTIDPQQVEDNYQRAVAGK